MANTAEELLAEMARRADAAQQALGAVKALAALSPNSIRLYDLRMVKDMVQALTCQGLSIALGLSDLKKVLDIEGDLVDWGDGDNADNPYND
jgi:hypothetical protein